MLAIYSMVITSIVIVCVHGLLYLSLDQFAAALLLRVSSALNLLTLASLCYDI